MTRVKTLLSVAGLAPLAACVNLAPSYTPVDPPIPAELPAYGDAASEAVLLDWQTLITSPELAGLIRQALDQNRNLEATAANVRAARASLMVSRSALFPTIGASGSLTEADTFDNDAAGAMLFSDAGRVQAGVTAWEIDFFGKTQNQSEAALQTYLSTQDGLHAAQIALIATIGETWLRLAADQELIALASETVDSQGESLSLTRELFDAGAANELDVRRASASVAQARAQAAQFEAALLQDRNLLRLLVGSDIPREVLAKAELSPSPVAADIPLGRSSQILLSRPDVMAAERQLLAANANIGAARAAFYPSITLTGSAGYASADLTDFVSGDGTAGWSAGPSISVPIFDFGRRQGNLDAARAQADAALAQYEYAIQSAFRETADVLAVAETIDDRLDALNQLAQDTDVTLNLSTERFRSGLDGYLTVLDAQRENYSARQQLINARLDQALNRVALYRVLGTWPGAAPAP